MIFGKLIPIGTPQKQNYFMNTEKKNRLKLDTVPSLFLDNDKK